MEQIFAKTRKSRFLVGKTARKTLFFRVELGKHGFSGLLISHSNTSHVCVPWGQIRLTTRKGDSRRQTRLFGQRSFDEQTYTCRQSTVVVLSCADYERTSDSVDERSYGFMEND